MTSVRRSLEVVAIEKVLYAVDKKLVFEASFYCSKNA